MGKGLGGNRIPSFAMPKRSERAWFRFTSDLAAADGSPKRGRTTSTCSAARLRRFIRAAHEHGIAVILDVVYNHLGPFDLDLWRFDGWRLMQSINQKISDSQPGKITIAEDLRNNEWLTRSRDGGGAGFASQWDAAFFHPVRQALIAVRDEDRTSTPSGTPSTTATAGTRRDA